MITGAHVIIYSNDAAADRAFLRDVIGFSHVDAGDGWLIFALPPAEAAVHPAERNDKHELYLLTDDVEAEHKRLVDAGATCSPVSDQAWGRVFGLTLPGGGDLGIYEPRHPTAFSPAP